MHTMRQVLTDALELPPIERTELIEELFFSFALETRTGLVLYCFVPLSN